MIHKKLYTSARSLWQRREPEFLRDSGCCSESRRAVFPRQPCDSSLDVRFFSSKKNVPWLQRALHCIGKAILADKADAANRHYEQQRQDGNLGPEINARRRSSAVRAVALFQKFKDYNEGGDGEAFAGLPF